jgi:predicted phosphodiesterase
MRLAFLSDIHGNPIALDAVLDDVQAQGGVDEYWVLGDLVAIGYDPVGVLERIDALPSCRVLRGNTERYVLTGERPPPTEEQMLLAPELLPTFVEVTRSFAWTSGYLAATGWLNWLAGLPAELRAELPDGTRLLAVHSTPRADDGRGLRDRMTDAELRENLEECAADVVLAGHTHGPFDRDLGSVRVVNLGSVSNPITDDLRASYVIISADRDGYQVEHRRVAYDYTAVIEATERSHHPSTGFLLSFFTKPRV